MNRTNDSYIYPRVYQEFIEIEQGEFRDIIRFYEANRNQINQLEFKEYFELLYTYTQALFEIGTYYSFIKLADYVLELVIENNIKYYNGEDIFYSILCKKGEAHYRLTEYDKAIHIFQELVKMKPSNKVVVESLRKCHNQKKPNYLKMTRALSVCLFIATALVIAIELFFIRAFLDGQVAIVENVRNVLFCCGWMALLGGDLVHRASAFYATHKFVRVSKSKSR